MKSEVLQTIEKAICSFNEYFEYCFSLNNVMIRFFTAENGKEVYEEFAAKYGFPHEEVTKESFVTVGGEAFAFGFYEGQEVDGIMLREEVPLLELYHIVLHELSHIYCMREEIEGGHYFKRFCAGNPTTREEIIADGTMNAGYAVWREFIAEYFAQAVDPETDTIYHLYELEYSIGDITDNITAGNPNAKEDMSNVLLSIMLTQEALFDEWEDIEIILKDIQFPFIRTAKDIWTHLQTESYYKITPEFISKFGDDYLFDLSENSLHLFNY